MENIESQENPIEAAIDADSLFTQRHDRKGIDRVIVSQDMSYAVTYNKEDNSILGWLANIEENGQLQQDVYFKFDQLYDIRSFVLHKHIVLFCYYHNDYRK